MPPRRIDWRSIATVHPELQIGSTTALGEGWSSRSFLVNGSLVFRFPKRPEVWPELEREIAFLAAAGEALPLRVPRYVIVSRASTAAAHGYAAYAFIPGRTLTPSALTAAERDAAADAIATFLRSLHGHRPLESGAGRLPRTDGRAHTLELRALADRVVCPELSSAQASRLHDWFGWYLDAPGHFSFSPVVIHGDFGSDHVLASEGRVTGVIDFSDVAFGDPDSDFASLSADVGEGFTLDVARRYGHADLDRLAEKLRYFEIADQVDTIVKGGGWALPGQGQAAWTRLRQRLS
jgi:aminoglycoside 2''-phosphotransferase